MAINKTEVIVLKTQPFRSSSLIITFYAKGVGKMKGIAKGVRQEGQSRGPLYELFSHLEIIFYEKTRSDLHLVSEAFMMESYEPLRTRLESISYASYFCDLVDTLSELQDPHDGIFELLDFSFKYLPSIPGPRLARLFEIRFFNEIGWLPYLDCCFDCDAPAIEEGFFSARQGALLCDKCAPKYADARPLKREALSVMRYYSSHSLEESIRLGMSKASEDALEALMDRFLIDRLNRPLKSRRFIEKTLS